MKKLLLLVAIPLLSYTAISQVGINNTDPKATLDLTASNAATPSNVDGILIPRIDEFPVSDPGADQDGMMVFVTGNGTPAKGFYYWDNGGASWAAVSGSADNDWTEVGVDLERQSGNVFIGDNASTDNDLYVSDRVIDWDDTAYYLDANSVSRLGEIQIDNGTSSSPSLYFGSDSTTGIAGGVNTIRAVVGGTTRHEFTEKGQIQFFHKQSIMLGFQAGENLSASFNNSVFIGNQAGRDETTGLGNNAIGFSALSGATGSNGNNFMGQYAATDISTGSFNTGMGGSTLRNLTTGSNNTAIGSGAGNADVVSSNNTYLGYQAGAGVPANSFNRTGNVFLGYSAGYAQDVNNRLYIENSSSSSPLIYGEFDNDIARVNGTFQINDPSSTGYALPTADGIAGQVLTTDGSGNLTFSAASADTDWVENGGNIERQSGDVYIGANVATDNDLYISDRIIDWDASAYYLDPATGSRLNEVDFDQGSTADPSITFTDADSGIFATNAGRQIDFVNDGTTSVSIASNGHMKLNTVLDYGQLGVVSGNFSNAGISARNTDAGEGLEVVVTGNRSTFGGVMSALTISQQGTSTNTVNKFGIYNAATGSGAGDFKALRNAVDATSSYTGRVYGVANDLFYNSSAGTYGVYNGLTGTNAGTKYGTYNYMTGGSGDKYGTYTTIGSSESGTHYGIYSDVQSSSGFAGYFLGRMYLGESSSNRYYMPAADGTNGQVITTDGAGNLSWTTSAEESSTASNGLTESGDDIQLGGTLSQNTTVTQANFGMTYDLTGTGDFSVLDNGTAAFTVEDSGEVGIGTATPTATLDIVETGNTTSAASRILKTDNTSAITYGLNMERTSNGTGVSRGIDINMSGTGTGTRYGLDVAFTGTGNASRNAFSSNFSGATTGTKRGIDNNFAGSGNATRMGMYNNFQSSTSGAQFGTYNQFEGALGGYIGTRNAMVGASNSTAYGVENYLQGTGSGAKTGVWNSFSGANANSNNYVGMENLLSDSGSGSRYGTRNTINGTGNGTHFGTYNNFTGTGAGNKYGSYTEILTGAGGTHYGTYNDVDSSNGWAGYFLGKNYVSEAIGINNGTPDGRLDIIHNSTGATSPHIMITAQNADTGSRIVFDNAVETTNNWVLFARADDSPGVGRLNFFSSEASANVLRLESDGKVGIMRDPTTNALEVGGQASKTTAGAFIANSDKRLKKNISSITGETALEKINNMRGVTYEWNDDKTGSKRPDGIQYGFIAQELQKVFPEKVTEDNLGYLQTAYGDYDPIFVEAIKALNIKVKNLESENEQLKRMLQNYSELEARITNLEGLPLTSDND